MIKMKLVAQNCESMQELIINENEWRPIRSLMAIANRRYLEREGDPIVLFEELQDIDENINHGLDESACLLFAREMESLIDDPFTLVDYGMTVDIKDGKEIYTYPLNMCTAYFEDINTGQFYESFDDNEIVGKQVHSWLRATKTEMLNVIVFLKVCGGFTMP